MAGSDLDGDLYFVTWHEELILKKQNEPPMDFPAATECHLDRPITEADIIQQLKFIVESDNKGRISRQHLIFADLKGIESEECLRLADLSAQMYDAPKTGVVPEWPSELKTKKAPDFLEKGDHREMYESRRVLGQLYRHSKSMLESVSRLSDQKCARDADSSAARDDDAYYDSIASDSVEGQAKQLQEWYAEKMLFLSRTYCIAEELKIWRARFPDFKNTQEEKQKRRELIGDLSTVQLTMQNKYESAVRHIEGLQQRCMEADYISGQLYRQCMRLRTRPLCGGFTLMLCGFKPRNEVDEGNHTYDMYRQIGRQIVMSLTTARERRLSTADCVCLLIDQSQTHSVFVLLRHPWILASVCYLVEHLCRQDDDISSLRLKLDCILRVVLHVNIKLDLFSPEDVVRSKDSVGFLEKLLIKRIVHHRLTKQLNERSSNDFPNVGKAVVYGLWDIYTKRETSRAGGYKSWERELQADAMEMLLSFAF